jgi:glycosyltransferase involved in cell wall biosynthesis
MISILIRNKNEAKYLDQTLKSISNQKFEVPYEIVFIDDHSTDDSVAIAHRYGCKVIPLDRKFTYGYALNFGIQHCSYDIILLLSSHNILLSNDFSFKLLQYFEDEKVAGVRCTPIANSKQIEQSLYEVVKLTEENYNHSKDWSNLLVANCSAIRKSVAEQIPFQETIRSNEEKLWCLEALKSGYTIYSNVPCYFIYNKKSNVDAVIRDTISKFQIDGIAPTPTATFLATIFKSIPWALKIALGIWYPSMKAKYYTFLIPFQHKKGDYK